MKQLCAFVPLEAGESILSSIARNAEINAIPSLSKFVRFSGVEITKASYLPFWPGDPAPLATFLNADLDSIKATIHPSRPKASKVDWYGTPIERRLLTGTRRRIAPRLFQEGSGYHRATWMIDALPFCPESYNRLVSTCLSCGHTLGWARTLGLNNCERCGEQIFDREAPLEDAKRIEYSHLAGLVSPDRKVRATSLKRLPKPFSCWDPGTTFDAIVDLAFVVHHGHDQNFSDLWRSNGQGKFDTLGRDGLLKGYAFACSWPSSFVEFTMQQIEANGSSGRYLDDIGPIACLFKSRYRGTPLRAAVEGVLPTLLIKTGIPYRRYGNSNVLSNPLEGLVNMKDAAKQFGFTKRQLKKAATACPEIVTVKEFGGITARLFPTVDLDDARSVLTSFIAGSRVAAELGVPPLSVGALSNARLIEKLEHKLASALSWETMYLTNSVQDLIGKLNQSAKVSSPKDLNRVPLGQLLKHQLNPEFWATVIGATVSGEIRAFRERTEQCVSRQLSFDITEVFELLTRRQHSPIPDLVVTSLVAEQLLGLSPSAMSEAKKSGLLAQLSLNRLASFRATYFLPIDVQSHFRGSKREFSAMMKRMGISPVANLAKQKIWLRDEVEDYVEGGGTVCLTDVWGNTGP